MLKRIGSLLLIYFCSSIIAGFIFYIYDTFFGSPRWEWPTIFLAIFLPFSIIYYNITGFILSIVFLKRKLYGVIAYIPFFINFIFSLIQMDTIYNFVKDIEILRKLHNNDMAFLNHDSNFILANVISIILIIGLLLLIKIYENNFLKQLIKFNDDKFKKRLLKIDRKDIIVFLNKLEDDNTREKYNIKIEQILGKDYLNRNKG